jgi:3-phenylpropionate/cinnamic acid dioxygenase small subunit
MTNTNTHDVDGVIYVEIQRFLFREAALLDSKDYAGWFALLTEDIHYRVTAQVSRDAGSSPVNYDIVDEHSVGLKSRIDQISNPRLTRAENPPSLMRRFVSNIEARVDETENIFSVTSYLLAYRSRPSTPEGGFYVAERHDVLRKLGSDWRLARRLVRLDQFVLFDGSLSALL